RLHRDPRQRRRERHDHAARRGSLRRLAGRDPRHPQPAPAPLRVLPALRLRDHRRRARRQRAGQARHLPVEAITMTTVERIMTTELYTARASDAASDVARLMDRERIRHVLVIDDARHLVGLISYRTLLRAHISGRSGATVGEIMKTEIISITPRMPTL